MEIDVNYNNICRICLTHEDLQPFIDEQCLSTFKIITNIEITPQDKLPQNICNFCSEQLTNIDSFIQQCKINDLALRSAISSQECNDSSTLNQDDCNDCLAPRLPDEIEYSNYNDDVNLADINEHIDLNHSEDGDQAQKLSTRQCPVCKSDFRSRIFLSNHYRTSIKCRPKTFKLFKCEQCSKEFTSVARRKDHMNLHTGLKPHVCSYCGKRFQTRSSYHRHIHSHKVQLGEAHESKYKYKEWRVKLKLKCNFCNDKIFSSRSGYANHLLSKHNLGRGSKGDITRNKNFLCNYCAKTFSTWRALQDHILGHSDEKPFGCDECDLNYRTRSGLWNHKLTVHQDKAKSKSSKSYKCDVCGHTFRQKNHCEDHKRLHTGEKPFLCNFCGKRFTQRTFWKIHLRMHTGEKPFACPVCDVRYHDKSSLRKHQVQKQHNILQETETM